METEARSSEIAVVVTKYLRPQRGGALRRDDARFLLRRTLEAHRERNGLVVYAWAFLPSKLALVVKLPTPVPLPEMLGEVFGSYTRRFNARYRRTGALFRSRFLKDVLISEEEIRRAIARVHAMPVSAALVARPGAEPWSSAAAYAGWKDGVTTIWTPPPRDAEAALGG